MFEKVWGRKAKVTEPAVSTLLDDGVIETVETTIQVHERIVEQSATGSIEVTVVDEEILLESTRRGIKSKDERPKRKAFSIELTRSKQGKVEKPAKPKMQPFKALVRSSNGEEKVIKLKALNRAQARLQVASQGLELLQLRLVPPFYEVEIGTRVPRKLLLHFTRQLASFSAAGIAVLEALELLAKETKNTRLRTAIRSMIFDIREGDGIARAAASHPDVFPDYYVAILHAAERSGDLAESVDTLANYLERDVTSVRAIRSALYYPAILFLLGIGAVIIMTLVVLPQFEQLFMSLAVELPPTTQFLLDASRFMQVWWPFVFGGLGALVFAFLAFRTTKVGALLLAKAALKAPVVGKLLTFISLERFSRILGSLVEAGVPLTDALQLSASVLGNKAFERGALMVREGVLRGDGLSGPMEQSGIFPAETVQLFKVGEDSGRLAEQLTHSSRYYAGEVDYRLKNLTSLMEPVILVVIGGGIGFIAVALISAMYGIYSTSGVGN